MPSGFYYPTDRVITNNGNWLASGDAYFAGLYHIGEDIGGHIGDPVYAVADGTVVRMENYPDDVVNHRWMWVDHSLADGSHFYALYAHISATKGNGDHVGAGEQIATIADYPPYGAGNDHLHFGIRPDGPLYSGWGRGSLPNIDPRGFVAPYDFLTSHSPSGATTPGGGGSSLSDGSMLSDPSDGAVYIIFGGAKFHVWSLEALHLSWSDVHQDTSGILATLPLVPRDGTILQEVSDPSVYIVYGGARFGVSSMEALGLDWANRHVVSDTALSQIPRIPTNGTLLREVSDPAVYVVYGGARFHVLDMDQLGLKWENIRLVSPSALAQIPFVPVDGTLLKEASSAPVFIVYGGAKFHVLNMEELGLSWDSIHAVSDGAMGAIPDVPQDGTAFREHSDSRVFVIRGGVKYWVQDLASAGLTWSDVHEVSDGALASFPEPSVTPPPVTHQPGDLDADGAVRVADVLSMLKKVAGLDLISDYDRQFGDMNGDGQLNIRDVVLALRKVAGLQ
jgi:hypothetical protein